MVNEFFYSDNLALYAHLFHEGTNDKAYEFFGAHFVDDGSFVRFVVWAPYAKYVNLMGDFNGWDELSIPLKRIENSGVWEVTVKGIKEFDAYKYRLVGSNDEIRIKADPFAFHSELRPHTASKVYDLSGYEWKDKSWLENKKRPYNEPISIYEVNLSSWKRYDDGNYFTFDVLAKDLVEYVKNMGYTHVELMPVTEFPYDGSWGYQASGYFSPSSRFGTPKDLMMLIDSFHRAGIGVIMDWVPVHFCKDDFALARFDGGYCFESCDYGKAYNRHWDTYNFDYSKKEVVNFLVSSALYWHDYYHIDGIRVDAVAYLLYKNMDNSDPNNTDAINYDAVEFIKHLNTKVYEYYPNTMMIAEESSAFPLVTKPVSMGGLGFSFKWNMGWMNDIIKYMNMDPIYRKNSHNTLTFPLMYAFSENFILPFSHDEVVHAKGSMLNTMFGGYEDRFKQLRLLYAYMFTHPGKKLNFMGNDFAQFDEWNEWDELDWNLLDYESHSKFNRFFGDLNKLYKSEKALYEIDSSFDGFEWIDVDNSDESVISYKRIAENGENIICVFSFTPVQRNSYRIKVSDKGNYTLLMNSNHKKYGGDVSRNPYFKAMYDDDRNEYFIEVDLAPYGAYIIKRKEK